MRLEPDVLVFGIYGELDETNFGPVVDAIIQEVEERDGPDRSWSQVEIDARALHFLSIGALRGLVHLRSVVGSKQATLAITRTQPIVRRVVTLAGLDEHLGLEP